LAAWEVQAHRTLATNPDSADVVRIARVQALITSTTGVISEAAATRGHIDDDVMQRLRPALEASQLPGAGRRNAGVNSPTQPAAPTRRWSARPASSAPRSRRAASNQRGWATPDQLATRVNLPAAVRTLRLSMVAPTSSATLRPTPALPHPHASSE
jgi:hypothetical protein